MRWLLYQPRSTVKINTPLQAAMQGLGAATADAAAAAAAPIPGLSTADNNTIEEKGIPLKEKIAPQKVVEEKGIPPKEKISPQKVGILNFLATCSLDPKETVTHYLAASVGILNFLATCSLNPKETVAHYLAASVDPNRQERDTSAVTENAAVPAMSVGRVDVAEGQCPRTRVQSGRALHG
eukprot:gene12148-15260_t